MAELLGELWACHMVLLQSSLNSFKIVRGHYCRIEVLPKKVALSFCCQCRGVLLNAEGALRIPVDCYDTTGSGHLQLEVCVMRYCIEFCKCSSSEQCMIATVKRDIVED